MLAGFIQDSFGNPCHGNQRNKLTTNWKGKVKLSLSADDMILYIDNPKYAARKLEELVN